MDSEAGGMVFKVAVFVIIALALYYFYKWLNGSGAFNDVVIYTSPNSGLPGMATSVTKLTTTANNVPTIFEGGEYSVSTWIYITNWEVNRGFNKPFLVIDGGGSTFKTMILYLGQNIPKLGIRTSTSDGSPSSTGMVLNNTTLGQIRPTSAAGGFGASPYTDTGGDFGLCDIESVDIQRWVNITVVLSGRTQDVYIDGKLSRSCVLPKMYMVDSGDNTQISLGGPYGFGGLIGQTKAADFAYSPDQVYKIYQAGPLDSSLWTQIKGYFDPSQYSFSVQRNGQNIVSGNTA
jgi:hypothetical protein